MLRQADCEHRIPDSGALAQTATLEIASRKVDGEPNGRRCLVFGESQNLRRRDGGTKDPEHRPRVETAGHNSGNEVGRHPLHDFIASCKSGKEALAGRSFYLCRRQGCRDDARTRVGQHAEGIPFSARQHHLCVRESRASLSRLFADDQHRRAVAHAAFFFCDEFHGLLTTGQLRAQERGSDGVKSESFCTIDHVRRQILITQTNGPSRQLPAE